MLDNTQSILCAFCLAANVLRRCIGTWNCAVLPKEKRGSDFFSPRFPLFEGQPPPQPHPPPFPLLPFFSLPHPHPQPLLFSRDVPLLQNKSSRMMIMNQELLLQHIERCLLQKFGVHHILCEWGKRCYKENDFFPANRPQ